METVAATTAPVAFETLTVGLPVRVTLTNGKSFEGYVALVQNFAITGRHVQISSGSLIFNLHHYLFVSARTSTETVGCDRISAKRTGIGLNIARYGTVSSIESLV